jgi:hypothetical protein
MGRGGDREGERDRTEILPFAQGIPPPSSSGVLVKWETRQCADQSDIHS